MGPLTAPSPAQGVAEDGDQSAFSCVVVNAIHDDY